MKNKEFLKLIKQSKNLSKNDKMKLLLFEGEVKDWDDYIKSFKKKACYKVINSLRDLN